MAQKIVVIEKVDILTKDGEELGRQVFGKDGSSIKIKRGQGSCLGKENWEQLDGGVGRAIACEMGEFKGYPFVKDFKFVAEGVRQEVAQEMQDKAGEARQRSINLSYAVELAKAGAIKVCEIDEYTEWFNQIVSGEIRIEQSIVVKLSRGPEGKPRQLPIGEIRERPSDEEMKRKLRAKGLTQGEVARNITKDYKVELLRNPMVMIHALEDKDFWEFWKSIGG